MDTELLKTFLEVQKTRHFGKAAENLYVTQSAVSFRIRQLEQSLGVALFTRFRNNIQLTNAGELLLPHAHAVIQAMIAAKQQLLLQSGRPFPYRWQISHELAFLFQQFTSWPIPAECNLQVQCISAAATIQEPLQRTDGYVGFASNNSLSESTARFSLGFLKLVAVATNPQPTVEVRWDVPVALPQLCATTFSFISSDVHLVYNYLKSHNACGYLPSTFVAQAQFELIQADPIWIEISAFALADAEWPSALALQLQAAKLLSVKPVAE